MEASFANFFFIALSHFSFMDGSGLIADRDFCHISNFSGFLLRYRSTSTCNPLATPTLAVSKLIQAPSTGYSPVPASGFPRLKWLPEIDQLALRILLSATFQSY